MRLLKFTLAVVLVSGINTFVLFCLVESNKSSAGLEVSAGDSDGSGTVDIADAVYLLSFLFSGGPPPVAIAQTGLTPEQQLILSFFSYEQISDGEGQLLPTVRLNGANLQIVNGLGATDGSPEGDLVAANGLGNVIVGYNEVGPETSSRTGSHNVLLGEQHSYGSVGSLLVGEKSRSFGKYAVVFGRDQESVGELNSILGGCYNTTMGSENVICGGEGNIIGSGGRQSVVVGGTFNEVNGEHAVGVGGDQNSADGDWSVVVGGAFNRAAGSRSVISGGADREVLGINDWRAGSLFEDQ